MAAAATGDDNPIEDLLDEAVDSAEDGKVTIGSLLDSFGNRSFGPLVSLFALIAIIPPVGGIPGVPTTMGVLIVLIAAQMLFGAKHPWVPKFLKELGVDQEKVEKTRDKAGKWAKRIDKLIGPRLSSLAGEAGQRIAAGCMVLTAAFMPPLELLPFAAALPAGAVLLFGLGIMARDGLLILFGYLLTAGVIGVAAYNFLL
ncbi:exopolysaccharide biosynthesis protein [Sphingomonas sp. CJ99]